MARNIPVLKEYPAKQKVILDILSNGGTLLKASIKVGVDRSGIFRYRMQDDDFDDEYRAAMVMGVEVALEEAEILLDVAESRDQIMKADKALRHAEWKAEKLLIHYQPKQRIEVEHSGPMILGWDTGPQSCPKCGWNMDNANDDVKVIDHGEGLQSGVSEIPFETGPEETPGGPQSGTATDGRRRQGEKG